MDKNKLLRVAMLLSLLAPTAESMTVLAQDVMLETHKATTNETSDSSSKEENNKNAAPTTSDKTDQGPLDASAETNSNSLVNADDKKRSDSSQSAVGSSDNKAEAENQVDDKSTDHSK
ncbi:TPA: CHAP domain-containing protein, partial [Streptococcus pyogenes]|nr:CHAP domain-containing protein [Streptococcus pyogenes]